MPIHDDYARITPFELALPPDRFGPDSFAAIRREVDELGRESAADEPGLFMGLDAVGRILAELREPEASQEDLQRHGILLYHAFHFTEAERPLFLLPAPTVRYLVEGGFEGHGSRTESESADDRGDVLDPTPPRPAGYLQLPRNLFWIETEEGAPPEPVDGFFWSAPDGESISVLVTAGVRSDRSGFSVLPLPRLPLAHAAGWVSATIREDGEDFSNDMPGAEMENLYALAATGEVLKLMARTFVHLAEVPGAALQEDAAGSPDDADPPASSLDYHRIALTSPKEKT